MLYITEINDNVKSYTYKYIVVETSIACTAEISLQHDGGGHVPVYVRIRATLL